MSKSFNIISIEINGVPVKSNNMITGELAAENARVDTHPIRFTGEAFQLASNAIPVEMDCPRNNPYLS